MTYKTKKTTVLNSTHLSIASSLELKVREYNRENSKDLTLIEIKMTGENINSTSVNKVEFVLFESIEVKGKEKTHIIGYREYYYNKKALQLCELFEYTLDDFNLIEEKEQILQHNIEELQKDI